MTCQILIVGASGRAAAQSALRAGLSPWVADLFADADLQASAPCVRCPQDTYPLGFREFIRSAPDAPVMYTGGLENHPDLILELSEIRPLWGNGPEALAKCRSPFNISRLLTEGGFASPEVIGSESNPADLRATGSASGRQSATIEGHPQWLCKPLRGCGGHGIREADDATPPGHYYQRRIDGPSMSAVFARSQNATYLLGVTAQIIGPIDWLNAPPFRYAGSIGPVDPGPNVKAELAKIGEHLGTRCDLRGLFGIDFVLADGRPWVIEVNPRYTASIEVLEQATGLKAIQWHRWAFSGGTKPDLPGEARLVVGKAILYAPCALTVPDYFHDPSIAESLSAAKAGLRADYADIPNPGEQIEAGWPILTAFANGDDVSDCLEKLKDCVKQVSFFIDQLATN